MNRIAHTLIAVATTALAVTSGCDTEGQDAIGPRGGTVTSPDGRLILDIPAGALEREVVVTIGGIDGPEGAMGPTYEILPRGTAFHFPAALTYDLTGEEMGAFEDPAAAMLVTQKADGWDALADHDVDMQDGTVTASALFLSAYTVVERD